MAERGGVNGVKMENTDAFSWTRKCRLVALYTLIPRAAITLVHIDVGYIWPVIIIRNVKRTDEIAF